MTISVKISEENYQRLSELSGKLQQKLHRPVSINDAITYLYKKKKLSDLGGAWIIREDEVEYIREDLDKGWGTWNKKSA